MEDNQLKIGIVAEASSLEDAMDSGAASTQQFAQRATASFQQFTEASKRSAEAAQILGEALDKATAAGLKGNEAFGAAIEELNAYTPAVTEAAEATQLFAASADQAASATERMGVSANTAAVSSLRLLEGSIMGSTRAAGSLLTMIPGMGEALEAAFPIIGALALGEVLVDVAEKIGKIIEEYETLGDIGKATLKALTDADSEVVKSSEKSLELRKQRRVLDAEMSGPSKGRAQRGAAAGAEFDIAQDENAIVVAQKEIIANQQRINELKAKSQPTQFMFGMQTTPGPVIGDYEARQNASQAEQVEQANRAEQAKLATLQQQLAVDKESAQLKQRESQEPLDRASAAAEKRAEKEREAAQERQRREEERTAISEYKMNIREMEEADREQERLEQEAQEKRKRDHEEQIAQLAELKRAKEEQASDSYKAIDQQTKSPQFTPRGRANILTMASIAEDANKTTAIEEEQAALHPSTNKDDAKAYQKLEDEKTRIMQEGAQKREQIAQQESARENQINQQLFDKMESEFNKPLNAWLTGTEKMSRAWTQMGDQMVISIIDTMAKIGAQELIGLVTHQTIGAQMRIDDAKTAAANTYQSVSAIPYIGWLLAPPAAAAAFAAVASFDVGTSYVPRDGMAMIHQGEAIYTRNQNQEMVDAVKGKSTQGGDNHFHYSPQISGIDGASVEGMARKHGSSFQRQMARKLRLMGMAQ